MRKCANGETDSGKSSRVVITLLIAAIILIFAVAVLGYYLLVYVPAHTPPAVTGGQREAAALQGSIRQMTDEEIQASLNGIVEEGMFRISIASTIVAYENGEAEVRIVNNPENRYVMQVTLYCLEEDSKTGAITQRPIYTTDLIDPGYYIEKDVLDEHMEPGEYNCLAIFSALYPDTEELVGTSGAEVSLRVFPGGTLPTPTPVPTPTPTPKPGK